MPKSHTVGIFFGYFLRYLSAKHLEKSGWPKPMIDLQRSDLSPFGKFLGRFVRWPGLLEGAPAWLGTASTNRTTAI